MIALHGEFDKITRQRLHNRLRQTAARLLNKEQQSQTPNPHQRSGEKNLQ